MREHRECVQGKEVAYWRRMWGQSKTVQRYIKITELIPEMLEKVDDGSMGFTPAVQLSFLKKKEQKEMLDAMEFAQCTPSLSQALHIKKLSADGKLKETAESKVFRISYEVHYGAENGR